MFNKDLIIPALLGLGLYSQNNGIKLGENNTLMLVALYFLLEDHQEIEHINRTLCTNQYHGETNYSNGCGFGCGCNGHVHGHSACGNGCFNGSCDCGH